MVEGKLPEVNPPSGRVPGRGLQALPILEARRRLNRGEITKKGSVFERIPSRGIYRRRGAARGATRGSGAPWRGHPLGRATRAPGPWWWPSGPTQVFSEGSFTLIFYLIFPEFLEHF